MASVLHLGKYFPPDFGGIETVTEQVAQGAARAGYRVTVLCFSSHGRPHRSVESGVRVVRSSRRWLIASQPLGLHYLVTALRECRAADILHLHWPNLLAAFCALAAPVRCKVVVHWHSDVVGKGALGRLTRPLTQALLRRADAVIATSANYADSSPELQRHLGKVHVSPIGIDDWTARTPSTGPKLPPAIGSWLAGRRLVLAAGRLVPYKGFDVLIGAAKNLPHDAAVVIVGDGPCRAQLAAEIDHQKVADRVLLTGRLSEVELRALLYRCTLFCLPSVERSEAFGVVMLEAMAAGIPVVATQIEGSGVPWVNQDDVTGINVPPNDEPALAAACTQILNSPARRASLGAAARARFVERFDSKVTLGHILDIYSSVLPPRAGPGRRSPPPS